MTMYYDPMLDMHHKMGPTGGLAACPYLLPQDPALSRVLWQTAATKIGWNDPSKPVRTLPEPRWLVLGLVLANELGDTVSETRLRETAEELCEPRFFGDGEFGWFFRLGEDWPRGQLSALMAMTEVGGAGSWTKVFNDPNLAKFDQPTVTGVDYPNLGLSQAWNDTENGALHVTTYAAAESKRGAPTTFRVENLPDPDQVAVGCDGEDHTRWRILDAHLIEIETDVGDRVFKIATGS
jgi:hypothetical protein